MIDFRDLWIPLVTMCVIVSALLIGFGFGLAWLLL